MHSYGSQWHLGMPHTISGALGEIALLVHAADQHWNEMGRLTGCPASRQIDGDGNAVYASVFFVNLEAPSECGLAAFGPDDVVELRGALGRYGTSMLDGTHSLNALGTESTGSGAERAPSIRLRLSFVLVAMGSGADSLRVATPSNARIDRIPPLEREPDSYRLVRTAQASGTLLAAPQDATPLWKGSYARTYPINPDRDLNGVGLLYYANYVAFFDACEREALQEASGFPPARVDGRTTVRRQIAYYGNARASDRLHVAVDGWALDASPVTRLLVRHSVRRVSDGRLIALASAVRLLRASAS
jgi:probable biosynthetic protein (TIGR04098 family)